MSHLWKAVIWPTTSSDSTLRIIHHLLRLGNKEFHSMELTCKYPQSVQDSLYDWQLKEIARSSKLLSRTDRWYFTSRQTEPGLTVPWGVQSAFQRHRLVCHGFQSLHPLSEGVVGRGGWFLTLRGWQKGEDRTNNEQYMLYMLLSVTVSLDSDKESFSGVKSLQSADIFKESAKHRKKFLVH